MLAPRWLRPMVEINCTAIVGGIKEELTSSWRRNGRGRKKSGREQSRSSQEKNNLLNYKHTTRSLISLSLFLSLSFDTTTWDVSCTTRDRRKEKKKYVLTTFCRWLILVKLEILLIFFLSRSFG